MKTELRVGDWIVGSLLRSGIYRIERIVPRYYDESNEEEGKTIGEEYDPIVVAKRCFRRTEDGGLKKQLGWDSCSAEGCDRLSREEVTKIEAALERDPKVRRAFEAYTIPPQVLLYNLGVKFDTTADIAELEAIVPFVREGRTYAEVRDWFGPVRWKRFTSFPHSGNLQLENREYELREKRLVYREARVHVHVQPADPEPGQRRAT